MMERLLKTWRREIPAMECAPGCRDCCEGDARAMTKLEWLLLGVNESKYSTGKIFPTCPFLGASGCGIYARRPLLCRIFGTVSREELEEQELAGTLTLDCPRGCAPARPLPLARALQIQVDYQGLANRELLRVIGEWDRFLTENGKRQTANASPAMPEKFEWLRYVLSTREGQATVRLLSGAGPIKIDEGKMEKMAGLIRGQ